MSETITGFPQAKRLHIPTQGKHYDDIYLRPRQVSEIASRDEIDTRTSFGGVPLGIPLIAAPMPDVCAGKMAKALAKQGGFGIVHRFMPEIEQIDQLHTAWDMYANREHVDAGAAVGLDDWDRVDNLYAAGTRILCIDTANGANVRVGEMVKRLKEKYRDAFVVAGNVASPDGFRYLESVGADAIRCGVAPGSACSTARATGIQTPMASTILDIARVRVQSLIIADGGIRTPADLCKALVLGADLVMAGNIFAGTDETPGSVLVDPQGNKVKVFRGAASYSVQRDRGKDPSYVEGTETFVPYKGAVVKVVREFSDGLRSSMSYFNARNLSEFRKNAEYNVWYT